MEALAQLLSQDPASHCSPCRVSPDFASSVAKTVPDAGRRWLLAGRRILSPGRDATGSARVASGTWSKLGSPRRTRTRLDAQAAQEACRPQADLRRHQLGFGVALPVRGRACAVSSNTLSSKAKAESKRQWLDRLCEIIRHVWSESGLGVKYESRRGPSRRRFPSMLRLSNAGSSAR